MLTSPVKMPDRVSGFRSRAINGILDYLDSLRPISSRTVRHEWRPDGIVSHAADGGGMPPPRMLFDLYEIGPASVKLRGTGGRTAKLFCLRGVWLDITGGTYNLDTAIDLSAKSSGYLCLLVTRTDPGGTCTIEHAAGDDPPDGDDDTEYLPLWYIPISGGAIVRSGIEDWRYTIGARVTAIE
jgi:hypothetical protein